MIQDAVRSHAWTFDAFGELVGAAPSLARRPQREDVLRGINSVSSSRVAQDHHRPSQLHAPVGLASGTV